MGTRSGPRPCRGSPREAERAPDLRGNRTGIKFNQGKTGEPTHRLANLASPRNEPSPVRGVSFREPFQESPPHAPAHQAPFCPEAKTAYAAPKAFGQSTPTHRPPWAPGSGQSDLCHPKRHGAGSGRRRARRGHTPALAPAARLGSHAVRDGRKAQSSTIETQRARRGEIPIRCARRVRAPFARSAWAAHRDS